jgi:hypothetical protein
MIQQKREANDGAILRPRRSPAQLNCSLSRRQVCAGGHREMKRMQVAEERRDVHVRQSRRVELELSKRGRQ